MKKLSSVVLTVIFAVSGLMAQQEETLFGESGLKMTGVWGGFVSGVTFFNEEAVATKGGFFGFEFNNILFVGFGNEETIGSVQLRESDSGRYNFKHKGFFVDYHPNREKVIHPGFGFMLGGGEVKDSAGNKDKLFVVQPSGGVEINAFKWWKIGLEGGYRFVSGAALTNLDDGDLSAFFINLKLRFGWSWRTSSEF